MIPTELKENEYLLKIRTEDNFGFLTKYNKNGTLPTAFKDWNHRGVDIPIQLHIEEYRKGWKFISYRIGISQSWALVEHPCGFKLEIYLKNLMELVEFSTIVKGEIIGNFKWCDKKLISDVSKKNRERIEKIEELNTSSLIEDITDEILKTDNSSLFEMWKEFQKIKNINI